MAEKQRARLRRRQNELEKAYRCEKSKHFQNPATKEQIDDIKARLAGLVGGGRR